MYSSQLYGSIFEGQEVDNQGQLTQVFSLQLDIYADIVQIQKNKKT